MSDLDGGRDGINAEVRHAGVSAFASNHDIKSVAGGHDRPWRDPEGAERQARPVVHAEHGVHRKEGEQTVFDHAPGTRPAFFRGLEDHIDDAVVVAMFSQVARGVEQHRHVPVVTAAVHLAGVSAGMRECVGFLHWQRIHVGAQPDGASVRGATFDDSNHSCAAQPAMHPHPPALKRRGDKISGALLFVG